MLNSLTVKHFQSHEDSTFEFCPGINAILGESNVGKTAAFRAWKKLSTNRPLGTRFKSDFAPGNTTSIKAVLDNKDEVLLEVGSNTNYKVQQNGKITEFKAFGADTPDLVKALLNTDDINMAEQLDKHYMICDSPGEVAKKFNAITRIEKVDSWVSSLTSKINGENRDIRNLEAEILVFEKDIFAYRDLDKLEEDISNGEYLESTQDKKNTQKIKLQALIEKLKKVQLQLAQYKEAVNEVEPNIERLEDLIAQITRKKALQRLVGNLIEGQVTTNKKQKFIEFIEPYVEKLNSLNSNYNIVVKDKQDIQEFVVQLKKKDVLITDWQKSLVQNTNALTACLKLLGKCPVCESDLDESRVEAIVGGL